MGFVSNDKTSRDYVDNFYDPYDVACLTIAKAKAAAPRIHSPHEANTVQVSASSWPASIIWNGIRRNDRLWFHRGSREHHPNRDARQLRPPFRMGLGHVLRALCIRPALPRRPRQHGAFLQHQRQNTPSLRILRGNALGRHEKGDIHVR